MKLHLIIQRIVEEKDYATAIALVKEQAEGNKHFKRFLEIVYLGTTPFSQVTPLVLANYTAPFLSKVRSNELISWEETLDDLEREYKDDAVRTNRSRMGYFWSTLDIMDNQDADLILRCVFAGEKPFDVSLLALTFPKINGPKQ